MIIKQAAARRPGRRGGGKMRLAVVDDNPQDREELMSWLKTALAQRRKPAECLEFSDGASFLEAAGQDHFDLVFLDIYMEGMEGVTAARTLRSFDPDCVLVFTTTSTDHALDGYRVRAIQYLVKPYRMEEVAEVLEEVLNRLPPEESVIRLHVGRQDRLLVLREILWADHFRHQIHIHLGDGTEAAVRMTFGEFTDLLREERNFLVCGRGVLVNLEHVRDFDGASFLLDDGTQVPVSRSSSETARAAFGEFLFQRRLSQ